MTFTTWLGSAAAVFLLNSGRLGTFTPASVSSEKITYIVQVEIVFSPSFLWCHTAIHLLFVRSSRWIYQPSRLWCVRHGAVWNGRKAEVCRWRTDHPGPNGWLGHPQTKWKGLLRNPKGNSGLLFLVGITGLLLRVITGGWVAVWSTKRLFLISISWVQPICNPFFPFLQCEPK